VTTAKKIKSLNFHQSGGFMGMNRNHAFVFADLSPARQEAMQEHIENCGILTGTATKKLNAKARDAFVYEFSVEAEGRHQATFDDTTLPPSYRPLLDLILDMIAENKGSGAES
jgi:hypothetical protein